MKTVEEMKKFLWEKNLTSQVLELVNSGSSSEAAIEYVYDAHTLTKEEFKAKYFG